MVEGDLPQDSIAEKQSRPFGMSTYRVSADIDYADFGGLAVTASGRPPPFRLLRPR